MAMITSPCEGNFIERLRVLASEVSVAIIGVLAKHRPDPVPVHIISTELGIPQSTASTHLARLRKARLVKIESRRKGYTDDSAELRAVIGERSYRRITQDFAAQNEDTPGQS